MQSLEKLLSKLEKVPFAAINVGDVVGKGRFKRVHRGRFKGRDAVVLRYAKDLSRGFSPRRGANGADKNAEKVAEEERDKNYNELRILALLAKKGSDAFVPDIFGVCFEPHSTIIVQEFASWSTLKSLLQHDSLKVVATNLHRLYCATQISRSMAYLESEKVVHADLSCRNVLIFRFEEAPQLTVAKVSDFGLSVVLKEGTESTQLRQPQATRWCAPETVSSNKLSHSADMWSVGVTCWEMYADGTAPWPGRPKRADVAARLKDIAETGGMAEGGGNVDSDFPRSACCPPVVHNLLLTTLNADEFLRPKFAQLADRIDRIIEDGGERDSQAEIADVSFAAEPPETITQAPRCFVLPPKAEALEDATPNWRAFCELAETDEDAAARAKALKVFPQAERELLLEAENRLKKQLDQIKDLRKEATAKQAKTPIYPTYAEVFGVSPLGSAVAGTPISPRVRGPSRGPSYVHASPSGYSSPVRLDSTRTAWPSAVGKWTIWSARGAFGPTDIQKREFLTEAEAWENFRWTMRSGLPCSLRDPSGAEIAMESWELVQEYCSAATSVPTPLRFGANNVFSAPDIAARGRSCLTPPRRSASPIYDMGVSPGRFSSAFSGNGVTPPRRGVDPQLGRACSSAAVSNSFPGGRTPPRMVPSATLQCW